MVVVDVDDDCNDVVFFVVVLSKKPLFKIGSVIDEMLLLVFFLLSLFFVVVVGWCVVWSHFHVKPNFWVEVELGLWQIGLKNVLKKSGQKQVLSKKDLDQKKFGPIKLPQSKLGIMQGRLLSIYFSTHKILWVTIFFLLENLSAALFSQAYQKSSSTKGCLSPRSSSTKGPLPLKVIFHQSLSYIKGYLLPNVIFHRRSSFTKGCLPTKVVLNQRYSSTEGRLLPKVIFHWRLSST